jgi:SAM-dependent methyltransferase
MTFPDHFSDYAHSYQTHRPTYPDTLFSYLASLAPALDLACDYATGNGQAALGLTPHFRSIVALDASPQQLALAPLHDEITYVVALADRTPLPDRSVDLMTVASAFHWFDFPRFYAEVRRIAKRNGILAVWGYKLPSVSSEVDAVVQRLDAEVLRDFWLPESGLVVEGYRTIPFPFDEINAPPFRITHECSLDQLIGFLGTWSASLRYRTHTGRDPCDEIRDELARAWK